jgi:outer membrane receptor for ferric coprogen and ferric-rhodotorulic acid
MDWFGLFASVNYVGNVFDTRAGTRVKYGDYVVIDLGARAFLDMERHHRIDVNLQNVFDEDYASRMVKGVQDVGGASYVAQFRGLPRTLSLHYTYNFF